MKKLIILLEIILSLAFVSCEKDEIVIAVNEPTTEVVVHKYEYKYKVQNFDFTYQYDTLSYTITYSDSVVGFNKRVLEPRGRDLVSIYAWSNVNIPNQFSLIFRVNTVVNKPLVVTLYLYIDNALIVECTGKTDCTGEPNDIVALGYKPI
ncbi:hypothetical protein M0Q50_04895 [bacterium]|jgi:hypothetical protein|nr:hypothetical protein [bacterium]